MITVDFKDFMEMKEFARELLADEREITVRGPMLQTPAPAQTVAQQVPPPVQQPLATVTVPTQPPVTAPTPPPVTQPMPIPVTPPVVPTTAASYTPDDLAKAAMTLMDAGRQGELMQLLASFGVESLPALPQTQYGAFATALRGMGAQI